MTRMLILIVALAGAVGPIAPSAWGQSQAPGQDQKDEDGYTVVEGPAELAYGPLKVILAERASAEIRLQPDARQLSVRTRQGESRIITSARNLVMIENRGGKVEVKLPTGRVINVEPGRTEIVGQALVDDPGQIVIRLAGLGPLVQLGGPQGTTTNLTVTVLNTPNPATLNSILGFQEGNPNNRPLGSPLSTSAP